MTKQKDNSQNKNEKLSTDSKETKLNNTKTNKIGLEPDSAERAKIKWQKRKN